MNNSINVSVSVDFDLVLDNKLDFDLVLDNKLDVVDHVCVPFAFNDANDNVQFFKSNFVALFGENADKLWNEFVSNVESL